METLLSEQQRLKFIEAAFGRFGCYYTWPDKSNDYSGKDLKGAKFPKTYDCSGLVTASLFDATEGKIDRRSTWNTAKLLKNCALITDPSPGDLCFYGSSLTQISHVMIWVGNSLKGRPKQLPNDRTTYGASGGDRRTLTPDIAKDMDASVKAYRSHKYRGDFRCFGRLVTNDD